MAREIRIRIELEHYHACHRCLVADSCKVRAILQIDLDEIPFLDVGRCYDCRLCISACTFEAISTAKPISSLHTL